MLALPDRILRCGLKIIFYCIQCRYIYTLIVNPDLFTIMKRIFLSVLLLLSFVLSNAQFKEIAAGPSFEEPTNGAARLLLMKNGNTVFLRVGFKDDGVDVRMYDQQHKEIVFTSFDPAYGKLKSGSLEGAFEIHGDIVVLVSEFDEDRPVLYRLIIDGKTGKLKEEKEIAHLFRLNKKMQKAIKFGYIESPDFSVSKDPESDNYAVVLFNSFETKRNKRIEIILYGSDNEEITRAYYESPEGKYKYMQFVSMAVLGGEQVFVLANAYNPDEEGKEVVLATLKKDQSIVDYNELNFPKNLSLANGIIRYNTYTKKLVVVAKLVDKDKEKNESPLYVTFIDPAVGKSEKVVKAGVSKEVAKKISEVYGEDAKYKGVPVSLNINKDGGFSVVYEEMGIATIQWSDHVSSHAESWDVLVSTFDKIGTVLNSYVVFKNFWIDHAGTATWGGGFGNNYKRVIYLNGPEKSYILLNDDRRNIEKQEAKEKPKQITGVSGCDAFYFPLTGSDPAPKRKYLFGLPEDPKERRLAPLGISVYDREHDIFIVMRLNKEERKKSVSIVWLKPE
jgi:hypothetical protein